MSELSSKSKNGACRGQASKSLCFTAVAIKRKGRVISTTHEDEYLVMFIRLRGGIFKILWNGLPSVLSFWESVPLLCDVAKRGSAIFCDETFIRSSCFLLVAANPRLGQASTALET